MEINKTAYRIVNMPPRVVDNFFKNNPRGTQGKGQAQKNNP
jgi:hypothetical protein